MSTVLAGSTALAACRSVSVTYGRGEARVDALRDVDLEIAADGFLALLGRSGSGKTTLLHILGGLLVPTAGTVSWRGEPLSTLDAAARGEARARGIAYVFQGSNLIPHLTAWENVAYAARVASRIRGEGPRPNALLTLVGLRDKGGSLPAELSGGESQRVAVARALAQQPELLLCDEPTGHLDTDTGGRVLDMIEALREELGFALVIATHDADVAARAERAPELAGGRIREETGPR
ncbi:MAG TPA: ABC transporter ATP-binding protein [Solirubrobacterales bacterium]|nr:ABC transporter ATP-binding protein [Solirubrobacterales bacterium]